MASIVDMNASVGGKPSMGAAADLASMVRVTRRVNRKTWSPALVVNELYLKGSNSGSVEVQAAFSSPGSSDSRPCHLAKAAIRVTPMAGEIRTRLPGKGPPSPANAPKVRLRAKGAPVE